MPRETAETAETCAQTASNRTQTASNRSFRKMHDLGPLRLKASSHPLHEPNWPLAAERGRTGLVGTVNRGH